LFIFAYFRSQDLDLLVNEYDEGKPCYLYTGRGPSGGMHLGHLVPFMFTRFLQQGWLVSVILKYAIVLIQLYLLAFDVPVVIQLTDDEKFLHRDLELDEIKILLRGNSR